MSHFIGTRALTPYNIVMRLLFLGSGSAYTLEPGNFQSNMVLMADNGQRLLIDCGSDIRWSLAQHGLSHLDIAEIYISHLHSDHIGGLEYVGFQTKFDPRCARPRLYLEASLVDPLWTCSLRGGMGIVSGAETTLETFFDVHPVVANRPFEWAGAQLTPVPSLHVCGERDTIHSFGLMIECRGSRTFLTTDTCFAPDLLAAQYAGADMIYHDCETGATKTGVHAHYDELLQLPDAIRAKTWLYDYQHGPLPDAVADGFRGFVRPGQCFDLVSGSVSPHTGARSGAPKPPRAVAAAAPDEVGTSTRSAVHTRAAHSLTRKVKPKSWSRVRGWHRTLACPFQGRAGAGPLLQMLFGVVVSRDPSPSSVTER